MSHVRDYKSLVLSSQFTFLVGPEQTCITVHRGLASQLSEPLDNLMKNGHMMESTTGTAVLDDVEVDVFVAFCEFAYTGSYSAPAVVAQETESAPEPSGNGHPHNDDTGDTNNHVHEAETMAENSLPVVSPQPEPVQQIPNEVWDTLEFVEPSPPPPDRPAALTFHAKVYNFATRYLIKSLRNLCLSYLYREMCQFPVAGENLRDVFDLVQYTYAHTNMDEPWGSQLRGLVAHYVACKADVLVRDYRMALIFGEAGQDLVRLLLD
ncbi:hypothetical protein VTN77DRAFT_5548 [Rasamsonia byssochlamydoides]|uniref:uncharacterized protein n=1 Tax=Rasamsonia byssochlamydoides TaxID=89139 RepID=UPI00374378A9